MTTDHQQIERLLYLYAEHIDNGDFAAVAELFRNASIKAPAVNSRVDGYDEVLAMYESATRLYDNGTPCTKHVITNVIIHVSNQDNCANARSYFTVYQALPDFPLQAIISGRYHDEFLRQEGCWRFQSRIMLPELFGDLSRHLLFDASKIQ